MAYHDFSAEHAFRQIFYDPFCDNLQQIIQQKYELDHTYLLFKLHNATTVHTYLQDRESCF